MLAFHGIFTAYGFWLPNDPRGSWSDWVASWELFRAGGKATYIRTRRSVAGVEHDAAARLTTKRALVRPPVLFTGVQARAIGRGFSRAVEKSGHHILACSILPDHVHAVVQASRHKPTAVVGHLKREASLALLNEKSHPFQADRRTDGTLPSCWAENSWRVYLDDLNDVMRAIRYAEQQSLKEGKRRQKWSFVRPFDMR